MAFRRVARVDDNQKVIVAALRKVGAIVKHCHVIKNLFDIIVAHQGIVYCMEIKDGAKFPKKFFKMNQVEKDKWIQSKLEPGEIICKEDFESVGVTYHIVYDIESALKVINS